MIFLFGVLFRTSLTFDLSLRPRYKRISRCLMNSAWRVLCDLLGSCFSKLIRFNKWKWKQSTFNKKNTKKKHKQLKLLSLIYKCRITIMVFWSELKQLPRDPTQKANNKTRQSKKKLDTKGTRVWRKQNNKKTPANAPVLQISRSSVMKLERSLSRTCISQRWMWEMMC